MSTNKASICPIVLEILPELFEIILKFEFLHAKIVATSQCEAHWNQEWCLGHVANLIDIAAAMASRITSDWVDYESMRLYLYIIELNFIAIYVRWKFIFGMDSTLHA